MVENEIEMNVRVRKKMIERKEIWNKIKLKNQGEKSQSDVTM